MKLVIVVVVGFRGTSTWPLAAGGRQTRQAVKVAVKVVEVGVCVSAVIESMSMAEFCLSPARCTVEGVFGPRCLVSRSFRSAVSVYTRGAYGILGFLGCALPASAVSFR